MISLSATRPLLSFVTPIERIASDHAWAGCAAEMGADLAGAAC